MPLNPDQVLQSRYAVQVLLHQGGMGAVYRAYDRALNCTVAVKERTPDLNANPEALAQARQQFQREAMVLAGLSHPNLPRVTNYFSLAGNEYLVMDFVEGPSLEVLLAQQGVAAEDRVTDWTGQLLDALAYIHSRQVIHRDIKPGNIILRPDGSIALVDFGLVKLIDPNDPRTLTALRGIGTAEYAPLEQYGANFGHTDARSDIYSLGATLYHLLTGRAPLPVHERLANARSFAAPRALNPDISTHAEAVVLKAMEIYPQSRFQSAAEMKQALVPPAPPRAISPEMAGRVGRSLDVVAPMPYTLPPRAPDVNKRRGPPAWLVAGLGLGIIAFILLASVVALALYLSGRAASPPASIIALTTATRLARPTVSQGPAAQVEYPTAPPVLATALPATPSIRAPVATSSSVQPSATGVASAVPAVRTIAAPAPSPLSSPLAPADSAISIPAGDFWMGKVDADTMTAADENPGHLVFVSAFWIDKYEVSNGQYFKCVEAGKCQVPAGAFSPQSQNEAYGKPGMEEFPVVTVSQYMASDYCKWVGKRLPTEAEWEKAARGNTQWVFPWGNQWDGYRANAGKNETGPEVITSYPNGCSPYGVCNVVGNVAEWIADNYGSTWYFDSTTKNLVRDPVFWSQSPAPQFNVRGGSFRSPTADARVSKRSSAKGENNQMHDVGFRCVKDGG